MKIARVFAAALLVLLTGLSFVLAQEDHYCTGLDVDGVADDWESCSSPESTLSLRQVSLPDRLWSADGQPPCTVCVWRYSRVHVGPTARRLLLQPDGREHAVTFFLRHVEGRGGRYNVQHGRMRPLLYGSQRLECAWLRSFPVLLREQPGDVQLRCVHGGRVAHGNKQSRRFARCNLPFTRSKRVPCWRILWIAGLCAWRRRTVADICGMLVQWQALDDFQFGSLTLVASSSTSTSSTVKLPGVWMILGMTIIWTVISFNWGYGHLCSSAFGLH